MKKFSFKKWLFEQEESSAIILGRKRLSGPDYNQDISAFCLHNPQINKFALENSTHMFIVMAFVLYTIQKEWELVRQTFPDFIKWVFETAIPNDNWDFAGQYFDKLGHLMGQGRDVSPTYAKYLKDLWDNKNEIFSNISHMIETETLPEFEIYKYITNNVKGFALAKAAFATQLIVGKFGCIDSINLRAYETLIKKDIKKHDKKSAFTIAKDTGEIKIKDASGISLAGYQRFLQSLEDLYGDNISKVLWNDWCEIVANKIIKSGTGGKIELKLNNQDFTINPYRQRKDFKIMMDKEKEYIIQHDPLLTGQAISKGHMEPVIDAGGYRTADIKATENFDQYSVK